MNKSTIIFRLLDSNKKNDVLTIEIWDYNLNETVSENVTKIVDVRGVKGFKKWCKEVAVTASTGRLENKLIGSCNISLQVKFRKFILICKGHTTSWTENLVRHHKDKKT